MLFCLNQLIFVSSRRILLLSDTAMVGSSVEEERLGPLSLAHRRHRLQVTFHFKFTTFGNNPHIQYCMCAGLYKRLWYPSNGKTDKTDF